MNAPGERLKWSRQRAGFGSAAAFARKAGIPEVTYRAHEKGPKSVGGRGLSEQSARSYAALLGVNWAWLMTGDGDPISSTATVSSVIDARQSPGNRQASELSESAPDMADIELPPPGAMPRNVPVRGTAVGGDDGHFEFNGEVIEYVRRSPGILTVKNIFAVYVSGSSMSPRFEEGELVFVHPDKPVVSGRDVLVELHGRDGEPGACYIKRLAKRTPTKLVLQQFNPPRADIEIPNNKVRLIYRILSTSELLGV